MWFWGLRFVFISATIFETIVNQSYIGSQVLMPISKQRCLSKIHREGYRRLPIFVLLLILPLRNERILGNTASISLG